MTARHYYSDPDLGEVEVTDRVLRVGWEVKENAEEGSVAMTTIVLDDPDMDLDIVGHRRYFIVEDDSDATDTILFGGYVADQEIARAGGEWLLPLGRVWTISLADANTFWQKRVMVGSNCNRPAETDAERMQWLLTTSNESDELDDVTTYFGGADPVDMDAADYRGQMYSQIADDCAQASGRNWWAQFIYDGADRNLTTWYAHDEWPHYDSPLFLSNDPTDWTDADLEAGTSLCWPISLDTKLRRDPSRVFSGCYLPYANGAVKVNKPATAVIFTRRDFVAPSSNVKTKAKAEARALRYLNELDEQDERITTTIELPKEIATQIRAGMRIPFKATHLPGYEDFVWCRVLACAPTPVASGERYRLALEIETTGDEWTPPPVYEDAYIILYQPSNLHNTVAPLVYWGSDGDDPAAGYPGDPKTGALDYITGVHSYHNEAVAVSGTGTVDIHARLTWAQIQYDNPLNVTVSIMLNGGSIGSTTHTRTSGGYVSGDTACDVTGVAVAPGDVISVEMSSNNGPPANREMFVPRGAGSASSTFRVSGSLA